MANLSDVRRIIEGSDQFAFAVPHKGRVRKFIGVWRERVDPKKTKVPNPDVLVIPVKDMDEKERILARDANKFFTEPHYDGYATVLVRLNEVAPFELEGLIHGAWRLHAPADLVYQLDEIADRAK